MRTDIPAISEGLGVFVMIACLSLPGAGLLVGWLTRQVLRPAISGTLQPEPFEVEMMAKSHTDAGRRGSGVSVGREG